MSPADLPRLAGPRRGVASVPTYLRFGFVIETALRNTIVK